LVEESMEVGAEEHAVANIVRTILRVRPDVGSLKRRQRVLVGKRTNRANFSARQN
jgi:hypothetical protein